MMQLMKRTLLACVLAMGLFSAPVAMAQDEEEVTVDARLEGYEEPIVLKSGGTAAAWFLMLLCGGIAVGVMFMNSKRTHLD